MSTKTKGTDAREISLKDKDFSHLDFKEVVYVVESDGEMIPAVVAGVLYDKGITVVRKDDPGFRLLCLKNDGRQPELYRRCFERLIKGIEDGVVGSKEMKRELNTTHHSLYIPETSCGLFG